MYIQCHNNTHTYDISKRVGLQVLATLITALPFWLVTFNKLQNRNYWQSNSWCIFINMFAEYEVKGKVLSGKYHIDKRKYMVLDRDKSTEIKKELSDLLVGA